LNELRPMIGARDSVCLLEWGANLFSTCSQLSIHIHDDVRFCFSCAYLISAWLDAGLRSVQLR
jgi:hypothetical protein